MHAGLAISPSFLGSARAPRALVGAPADQQTQSDYDDKLSEAGSSAEDFGEGAEISTRGRVRSPEWWSGRFL